MKKLTSWRMRRWQLWYIITMIIKIMVHWNQRPLNPGWKIDGCFRLAGRPNIVKWWWRCRRRRRGWPGTRRRCWPGSWSCIRWSELDPPNKLRFKGQDAITDCPKILEAGGETRWNPSQYLFSTKVSQMLLKPLATRFCCCIFPGKTGAQANSKASFWI